MMRLVSAALLIALPIVSAAPAAPADLGAWETTLGLDNPLVGKVWDVAGGRFVSPEQAARELAGDRFVLLGEKHDNPDHHRLQAWVLSRLVAEGRRPAVAFEMFTTDQQETIDRALAAAPHDADRLAEAVAWESSGWPAWTMYRPIFEVALRAGLPIVAANLDPATTKALSRGGVDAVDPATASRLGLDRPLDPETRKEMAAEIVESHCGYANEAMVGAMIAVQRGRDGSMARAMLAAGGDDGSVLVTGFGHAREDRGVPADLVADGASGGIGAVAFLEVQDGDTDPAAYAEAFDGRLPFDFVWFTPRLDDEDPCDKFRDSLKKLEEREHGGTAPAGGAAE